MTPRLSVDGTTGVVEKVPLCYLTVNPFFQEGRGAVGFGSPVEDRSVKSVKGLIK